MAQTQAPCYYRRVGRVLPYLPPTNPVYPGDVVIFGSLATIATQAINPTDIVSGWVAVEGTFECPKDTSSFSVGDPVYWSATGNPVVGTAGTGAMTSTASGNTLAGQAMATQVSGDATVHVNLNLNVTNTNVSGAINGTSLTSTASTFPIAGQAGSSSAGG